MITYVVEPRIVPLVRAGRVVQLLRGAPVRPVRPGERFGLIDSRSQTVIPDPVCRDLHTCEIGWSGIRIAGMRQGGIPVLHLDRLAQACGYDCIEELEVRLLRSGREPPTRAFIVEWVSPEAMMAEVA